MADALIDFDRLPNAAPSNGPAPGGGSLIDFSALPDAVPAQSVSAPRGQSLIDFDSLPNAPQAGIPVRAQPRLSAPGSLPVPPAVPTRAPVSMLERAGAVASDIGGGVMEAPGQILGGARDAWQETAEALESFATWAGDTTGFRPLAGFASATDKPLPDVDDAETTTGGLVRGVSQFLTAFIPAAKALGVANAATKAGAFGRAAVAGAGADAFAFDPHEARLSNLVEQYPSLQNPITGYLASDPTDTEAEGRFKNALEGLGLGTVTEGLFQAVRAIRGARRAKGPSNGATAPADGQVASVAHDTGQTNVDRPAASVGDYAKGDRVRLTDPGGPNDGALAEVIGTGDRGVMIRLEDGREFGAGPKLLQKVDAPAAAPVALADEAVSAPAQAGASVPDLAGLSGERLSRLGQTFPDDAVREAVRAEMRGRGLPVPDFSDISDPVASARAMADLPPTKAENAARGAEAFDAAAGGDLVRSAMYRSDLGPVSFDFGRLSERVDDLTAFRDSVVDVLSNGTLKGKPESGRVAVQNNGAVVTLNRRDIGGRETWTVDSVRPAGGENLTLRRPEGAAAIAEQMPVRRISTGSGGQVSWRGPLDLLAWVRSRGGLWDDAGELRTIGLDNKARKWNARERFLGPVVRGDVSERAATGQTSMVAGVGKSAPGMTLDDATLAAWEDGFFGAREDRPTVQEFLELLDTASRADSLDNAVLTEADRLELDALPSRMNLDEVAYREDIDTTGLSEREAADKIMSEAARSEGDAALPADFDRAGGPAGAPITGQGRAALDAVNAGMPGKPVAGERAGNIRLDRLQSPEDIRAALNVASDQNAAFGGARRGVVSDDALSGLADDLGLTVDALKARRVGQSFNAEELLAARRLLAQSGEDLVRLAQSARGGSDEALAAFQRAWTRHVAIQEQVSGATAEAGRALRQFRLAAQTERQRVEAIKQLIDTKGGRDRIEDLADKLSALDDPAAVNKLSRKAYQGGFFGKLNEYWINALLSGPQTHIVNITSNALTHLYSIPEDVLAAGFGAVRGGPDRVFAREAGQRAFSLVEGARDALRATAKAARTGEGFDATYSKLGEAYPDAIGGTLGKVVRIPTRLLEVEDTFFKTLAYRTELNALAVRQAIRDGAKGGDFARKVAEYKANPTDSMVDSAIQRARVLTFTNPLGPAGSAISRLRTVPGVKWIVPFIKTPTNILKFAARRSPAAPLLREFREDIAAGGMRRDRALAQITMGSTLGLAAFSYAREGLITGGGPSDPKERQALFATGWQPYSIKIGDTWYSYDRLDPLGLTIGVAADMAEVIDRADETTASEMVAGLALSFVTTLKDKSYLSGISGAMNAIDDPDRYAGAWLRNMGASFIPNAIGQYTRASDPYLRENRTFVEAVKARLPGYSDTLFPKRDVWGEPIKRSAGALGDDTAGRLLSPVRGSPDGRDPVTSELIRLDLTPTKASRTLGGVELSPAQYDELQQFTGRFMRRAAEAVQNAPAYDLMPDPARRFLLNKMMGLARSTAREAFYARWPEVRDLGTAEKNRALIEGRSRERVTQ